MLEVLKGENINFWNVSNMFPWTLKKDCAKMFPLDGMQHFL